MFYIGLDCLVLLDLGLIALLLWISGLPIPVQTDWTGSAM